MPPIQRRKELFCTVGSTAAEYKMYPMDGLCHYLFYTHVFIHSNFSEIRSTRIVTSFNVFQERMLKYRKTQGGLSFDVRASNRTLENRATGSLTLLKQKNIVHYGSLNVIDRIGTLADLVARALALIKDLKNFQAGDPTKRTVIAIGGIGYGSPAAWSQYKETIKQAAAVGSGVDTVIAISSVSSWLELTPKCKTLPPAIITASNKDYPSLERHMELVDETTDYYYGNLDVVVGLSLEMGALMYHYGSDRENALKGAVLYGSCTSLTLVPLDMGCESGSRARVNDTNIAFGTDTKRVVLIFDDNNTVAEKVKYVLGRKPRKRFAWLYFDVHTADFMSRCNMRNPFSPILVLRKNFSIGNKP